MQLHIRMLHIYIIYICLNSYICTMGRRDLKIMFPNKATPTNVLSITGLEHEYLHHDETNQHLLDHIWYAHFLYYHFYKMFNAA